MTHLVIGLGEVGHALAEILDCAGLDPGIPSPRPHPGPPIDMLHVTIPWAVGFAAVVRAYQDAWRPLLTVVHSTVPIGTTRQIPRAVHSPVLGRWRTMRRDLLSYPKWIGGEGAAQAEKALTAAGMTCRRLATPEQTEALKLLCLAEYGAALAMDRYRRHVADIVGLDHRDLRDWDEAYNEHIEPTTLQRRILEWGPEAIGGHCVIPGAKILETQVPHPLIEGILQYAGPVSRESTVGST